MVKYVPYVNSWYADQSSSYLLTFAAKVSRPAAEWFSNNCVWLFTDIGCTFLSACVIKTLGKKVCNLDRGSSSFTKWQNTNGECYVNSAMQDFNTPSHTESMILSVYSGCLCQRLHCGNAVNMHNRPKYIHNSPTLHSHHIPFAVFFLQKTQRPTGKLYHQSVMYVLHAVSLVIVS